MDISKIRRRVVDVRLAVTGYKHADPPDWLRLTRLASLQAKIEESDERALAAIADEIRRYPKAAKEARERLAPSISCYEGDRAVRLLDAAMHASPVQPIRPECVDLFGQEARLARMTLREAFAELASHEPEIERIAERLKDSHAASMASGDERAGDASNHAAFVMLRDAQREVAQILGPLSQQSDPLLRSYIPRNIVYSWLRNISGILPRSDPDTSYFSQFDVADSRQQ